MLPTSLQLVFYLEACESGSMFLKLPKNIDVFATTAAGPDTSSYACYWDEKLGTFLGDVYSVKWMEDSDKVFVYQDSRLALDLKTIMLKHLKIIH